ncbi:MAG: right-handed parallel beta-helix repeat-containing protein [Ardenticatenaceae bacterium]|nr:right-handed parallel beta-helix repeat-containing protein [Ardenticatenaceae bacterium]
MHTLKQYSSALFHQRRSAYLALLVVLVTAVFTLQVQADTISIDFESFNLGSVDGQDGWGITGGYDVEIVDATGYGYATFGDQSLRISNAVTSGSFGDHLFSQSLVDEAGETDAENGGLSGGTRQAYFAASWDFASTTPGAEQPGLSIIVSPDRGDGARMSWIQMADTPAGLEVNFYGYDTTLGGTCGDLDNFVYATVATGLDRTVPHNIRVTMAFADGINNDVMNVYIDGVLVHTGKTWEDYFRNCEPPNSRTVDSLLFRSSGTAAPDTSGNGFLIDNVQLHSGPACGSDCYVDASTGNDLNGGTSDSPFATIQRAIDVVEPNGTVHIANGTYPETLDVNKSGLTLDGESRTSTLINASSFTDYSLDVSVDNITLQDFTLIGNGTSAGTYGIKAAGNTPARITNFTVENVLVLNSYRTGVDLNGVDGALIKDVEVQNVPSGNGLSITDVNDIVFENITTSNNAWGGLAIYTYGRYFPLGSDNVTIQGVNSFGEENKVYVERGNYNDPGNPEPVTNLTVNGFDYTVMNDTFRTGGENFTFYQISQSDAIAFALSLATPEDSYVNEIASGDFWVGQDDANSMTFQTAVAHATAGDTIHGLPGTYAETITIDRSLTLTGAGDGDDPLTNTILDGTGLTGRGIFINSGITDVMIEALRIQNYANPSGTGIWAAGQNNNFTVQNVTTNNNGPGFIAAAGGIYMNGPVDNVLIDNVTAHNNTGRGIVIWNGFKTNITITNNDVQNNNCCGIELQDGTASGVTMTGNTVMNNGDSGMSAVGLTSGAGPNLIANNVLDSNGRFGIEIKLPDGTGLDSGDGSIVIENNIVSLTTLPTDLRDYAGIAAFRRSYLAANNNVDIPTGVIIRGNTVSGYTQTNVGSTSTGFGIVVEGTNMVVTGNTLNNNDVGVQSQAGHLPYTANASVDGDQSNLDDDYFGRGNSPVACTAVTSNSYSDNGADFRTVGPTAGLVQNVDTNTAFCGIQEAIDDASTLNGHTLQVAPGLYIEDVTISKSLALLGPNVGSHPQYDTRDFEAIISGVVALDAGVNDVTIAGFTIQDGEYGVRSAAGTESHSGITVQWNDFVNIGQSAVRHGLGFGGGSSTDWTVSHNRINDLTSSEATAVVLFNTTGVTITNNYLRHTGSVLGRRGINLDGIRDAVVSNNDIDLGVTDFTDQTAVFNAAQYALQLSMSNRSSFNLTIDNNSFGGAYDGIATLGNGELNNATISNNSFSDLIFGIRTQAGSLTPISSHSNLTIEKNVLTNLIRDGIRFNGQSLDGPYTNIVVQQNHISGNGEFGLRADSNILFAGDDTAINAACNWWGSADGPSGSGTGTGDAVSDLVTFVPWLLTDDLDGECDSGGPLGNEFTLFLPLVIAEP